METNKLSVVAILYADIKGFSNLNDFEKNVIYRFRSNIEKNVKMYQNYVYSNTAGDSILVVMNSATELAKIALKIKDDFRNTCWRELNISNDKDIKIRIALHYGDVTLHYMGNRVVDVMGSNVDFTARIEPIVELNEVFCSKNFLSYISSHCKIKSFDLGTKDLAKSYGKAYLYKLCWDWEYKLEKFKNNTKIVLETRVESDYDDSSMTLSKECTNSKMILKQFNTNNRHVLNLNSITTIGRSKTNNLNFSDGLISKKHCIIRVDIDGNVYIKDNNSTNGTFVNNNKIPPNEEIELKNRDKLKIGNTIFELKM